MQQMEKNHGGWTSCWSVFSAVTVGLPGRVSTGFWYFTEETIWMIILLFYSIQ